MNTVRHPSKPLLRTAKIVVIEETSWFVVLASEDIFLLASRSTVKINDDIDSEVSSLLDDSVEVRKHAVAISKRFASLVDDISVGPVSDGDSDGVESYVMDGLDSCGVDPVLPMLFEAIVASFAV